MIHLQRVYHRTVAVVEVQNGCLCAGLQHSCELLPGPWYTGHVAETIAHCHSIKGPVCRALNAPDTNQMLPPIIDLVITVMRQSYVFTNKVHCRLRIKASRTLSGHACLGAHTAQRSSSWYVYTCKGQLKSIALYPLYACTSLTAGSMPGLLPPLCVCKHLLCKVQPLYLHSTLPQLTKVSPLTSARMLPALHTY